MIQDGAFDKRNVIERVKILHYPALHTCACVRVHVFNLLRAPVKHLAVLVSKETCRAGRSRYTEPVARRHPHARRSGKSHAEQRERPVHRKEPLYTGWFTEFGTKHGLLYEFFCRICLAGDDKSVGKIDFKTISRSRDDRTDIELEALETHSYTEIRYVKTNGDVNVTTRGSKVCNRLTPQTRLYTFSKIDPATYG